MSDELDKIRKENFRRVIENNHGGDYKEVASLIGRKESTTRKYFVPSAKRPISNTLARDIERKLNLPLRYLDKDNNRESEVYFVMLVVENNERYRVVQWLYENAPEVLDCSGILGQYDVLLKVQVPSMFYLDKFFARLSRQPHIIQSQTFFSVNTLRWQKNQTEHYCVENPREIKNFMDFYKNKRLNDLAKQMQDIEKGKIVASDKSAHRINLHDVIEWANSRYYSIREYKEKIHKYDEYLKKEKSGIENGVDSKRIFLLPKKLMSDDSLVKERRKFFSDVKKVTDIGSEVRFLFNENWLSRSENFEPECFAIVDNEFVYVRKMKEEKAALHEDEEYIDIYKTVFHNNWEIATTYEMMLDIFNKRSNMSKFSLEGDYGISRLIKERIRGYESEIRAYRDELKYHENDDLEENKNKKNINTLQSKINDLRDGGDVILTHESVFLDQDVIIKGAKRNLRSVRWTYTLKWYYDHNRVYYERYIEEEKKLIKNGVISHRITFLPKDIKKEWEDISFFEKVYQDIGCKMKYILLDDWIRTHSSKRHERFMIIDKKYACLKRDDEKHHAYVIKREPARIEDYINVFEENWDKSMTLDQVKEVK